MKKLFILLTLALILSGCVQKEPVESRSEKEMAACSLIQQFVVFHSPDTEDVSQVDCNFKDSSLYVSYSEQWVAISPKPSKEHPNYENYIRNVKYREKNNIKEPDTTLLIDVENEIVMDTNPNIKDPEAGRFFKKEKDGKFSRVLIEELIELYGEEILNAEKRR